MDCTAADIRGVRLASPSISAFRPLALSIQSGAQLVLRDVVLETDCHTVNMYQAWLAREQLPNNASVVSLT